MPALTPLRPVYTRQLAQRLRAGECLNLVGHDDQGCHRLLTDLLALLPTAVYVDWPAAGDAAHLWQRLGQPAKTLPVDTPAAWAEAWKNAGLPLLLLDHANQGPPLPEGLAAWTLQPAAGLLCASEAPLRQPSWVRGLTPLRLPPLNLKRIREELFRFQPDLPDWVAYASPIFSHPRPYALLQVAERHLRQPLPPERHPGEQVAAWAAELDGRPAPTQAPPAQTWWQRFRLRWQGRR